LRKALDDFSEEGVIQVFYPEIGAKWIVGVVGQLQLDVLISAAGGGIQGRGLARTRPLRHRPLAQGQRRGAARPLPISTRRTSPRTAMAIRCSWRARRGTWAISRKRTPIKCHPELFSATKDAKQVMKPKLPSSVLWCFG
jgi:hypothetical protein